MELVIVFFSTIIAVSIFSFILKRWMNDEKIDKGIEILLVFCFYITFQSTIWTFLVTTGFAITLLIQAVYNYKKWKKEDEKNNC